MSPGPGGETDAEAAAGALAADALVLQELRAHAEAAREETRFEIRLLHERVNTLLAAAAFLTIAYTTTMSSGGLWSHVVAPVLSLLGLLFFRAVPGVLVLVWVVLLACSVLLPR